MKHGDTSFFEDIFLRVLLVLIACINNSIHQSKDAK